MWFYQLPKRQGRTNWLNEVGEAVVQKAVNRPFDKVVLASFLGHWQNHFPAALQTQQLLHAKHAVAAGQPLGGQQRAQRKARA